MSDSQYTATALGELRKNGLLIQMAREYLSEDVFLKKFGKGIATQVQKLKDDIVSLKKEYPGKFKSEIETDSILDRIDRIAQTMANPDQETKDRCASGDLGRALESEIKSITGAVHLIQKQVYGGVVTYTRKDSVAGAFDRISHTGRSMGSALLLGFKIFLGLIIIALLAFLYLFFTMEKEGTYLKETEKNRARITGQREVIAQLDEKREEILKKIKGVETGDMERGSKITLLELEVQAHDINQDIKNAEAEIVAQEKKLNDHQKKIEEIKEKPFIKRLLRQDH